MITKKRDDWFNSSSCTVKNLIDYMFSVGQMRDAQVEAIKTYLFLNNASKFQNVRHLNNIVQEYIYMELVHNFLEQEGKPNE